MTNTELIKKLYTAFASRDREQLRLICSTDIIWKQNPGFPGGGINTGIENIIKNVYEANTARWASFSFTTKKISSLGDTVVVEGHYEVQSKKSKRAIQAQAVHIFNLNKQKVQSFQQYTDTKLLWDNFKGEDSNETLL